MLDLPKAQDLLQSMSAARIAGDVDALMEFFDENATFRIIGLGAAIKGRDAIRTAIEGLVADFAFIEWRPLDTVVHGQTIAVRQHLKVRHARSGKVVESETAEFLAMKDGRCVAFTQFADTALIAELSGAA